MEPTPEQAVLLERLHENESLTDNLTDRDAKGLLEWAQKQILDDTDGELVFAAVSAANDSGQEGVETLIAQASATLSQELAARAMNAAPGARASFTPGGEQSDSTRDTTREARGESSQPKGMQASGNASEQRLLTGRADAKIGAAASDAPASPAKSPSKKARRKSKHKSGN